MRGGEIIIFTKTVIFSRNPTRRKTHPKLFGWLKSKEVSVLSVICKGVGGQSAHREEQILFHFLLKYFFLAHNWSLGGVTTHESMIGPHSCRNRAALFCKIPVISGHLINKYVFYAWVNETLLIFFLSAKPKPLSEVSLGIFFSFSFLLDAGKTLLVWFLMSCQLSKHIPVQLFTHGRNYTTAHHVMPVCTILWWNPTLNPPPPHKSFQIDTT